MIFIEDLQWWKSLYIPHSKNLDGERERRKSSTVSWLYFQLFCFYVINIIAANENNFLKNSTSWNKQEKHYWYLYSLFTKDNMHRKAEFCSIDLTSPQQNQISWKLVLSLNDKMSPLCVVLFCHIQINATYSKTCTWTGVWNGVQQYKDKF